MARKYIFPCEGEKDLAEQCLLMKESFWIDNGKLLVSLSYRLAVRNGIKNQFCTKNE
jgi:hypothetical protein